MTGVLVTRDTRERQPCSNGSRERSDVSVSRGSVRTADKNRKLEEAKKDAPLQVFRESMTQPVA